MIDLWRPSDQEGAIDVIREVYQEYGFTWDVKGYHADLYDVRAHYLDPGDLFFVARDQDRVIGTVAVEFFPPIPGPGRSVVMHQEKLRLAQTDCSLERLYVGPEHRRSGIGRALFQTAIEEARSKGASLMEIWSDKRFQDAHRLYDRMGADTVGERICDDPDHSPEWGLILDLAAP